MKLEKLAVVRSLELRLLVAARGRSSQASGVSPTVEAMTRCSLSTIPRRLHPPFIHLSSSLGEVIAGNRYRGDPKHQEFVKASLLRHRDKKSK